MIDFDYLWLRNQQNLVNQVESQLVPIPREFRLCFNQRNQSVQDLERILEAVKGKVTKE